MNDRIKKIRDDGDCTVAEVDLNGVIYGVTYATETKRILEITHQKRSLEGERFNRLRRAIQAMLQEYIKVNPFVGR